MNSKDKDNNNEFDFFPKSVNKEDVFSSIENYLSTNNVQNNINTLIFSTLSNSQTNDLKREEIVNLILKYDYIKSIEKEILENLHKKYNLKQVDDEFVIQNKRDEKNYNSNKVSSLDNILHSDMSSKLKDGNRLGKLAGVINNNKKDIDNYKLINYLIEEIVNNNSKLENLFNELILFKSELIIEHNDFPLIVDKMSIFMHELSYNDKYQNEILTRMIEKIMTSKDVSILIKLSCYYMKFIHELSIKFFNSAFDINKFYKISFNLSLLNKVFLKIYKEGVISNKIDKTFCKCLSNLLISLMTMNYNSDNSVYILSINDQEISKNILSEKEKILINSSNFGISTMYILLLSFTDDPSLASFKIVLKYANIRKYFIENFDIIKFIPFINYELSLKSYNKKHCYLWKHFSVMEPLLKKKNTSKKSLIYSWFSIKLNFLGYMLRYKELRRLYFRFISEIDESLTLMKIFINLFEFCYILIIIFDEKNKNLIGQNKNNELSSNINIPNSLLNNKQINKKDFDNLNLEIEELTNLIYLIKEILCDFILYNEEEFVLHSIEKYIVEIGNTDNYSNNTLVLFILDDIKMAINDSK